MFKKIAIIGGAGKMGSWFGRLFSENKIEVFVSDKNKNRLKVIAKELGLKEVKNNIEAVKNANFILISVLLKDFEKVCQEIAPHLNKNHIIIDICSLKEIPMKIMHKYFKKNLVLGTHPLFGPDREIKQSFILTPTNKREKDFAKNFETWLEKRGFKVVMISPKKHDELMSWILGLPHFIGLVTGSTLLKSNLKELKMVLGPSFQKLFDLVKNVVFSEPNFYSELHFNLPKINNIETFFQEKVKEWRKIIKKKARKKFIKEMLKIKNSLKNC